MLPDISSMFFQAPLLLQRPAAKGTAMKVPPFDRALGIVSREVPRKPWGYSLRKGFQRSFKKFLEGSLVGWLLQKSL